MQILGAERRSRTIGSVTIRLLTFAVLRDALGFDARALEIGDGARPIDVWNSLRENHAALDRFAVPPMFAINEAYAAPDATLSDGDELALIPPVSGG